MMFGLGPAELVIIAVIMVLLFGGKRFASLGKDLGSGIRNFKDGLMEVTKSANNDNDKD